jgi:hypothetical protein
VNASSTLPCSCGSCTTGEICDTTNSSSTQCVCVPDCAGKTCGPDGCGGSCGQCPSGYGCNTTTQQCSCTPTYACQPGDCGDDGCGRLCDSTVLCGFGPFVCTNHVCNCVSSCTGKACGDDGCGGSCGVCDNSTQVLNACNASQQCSCTPFCRTGANVCGSDGCGGSCGTCSGQDQCVGGLCTCVPSCAGKTCGSDGCGGSCGSCVSATLLNNACNASSQCQCTPFTGNCGSDGCGGTLGACQATEYCSDRTCVPVPSNCQPSQCLTTVLTIQGIPLGPCGDDGCNATGCGLCTEYTNNAQVVCPTGRGARCQCVPDCAGKNCGSDGCGGTCGDCFLPGVCTQGTCACTPNCGSRSSGPDGCGGTCATACISGLVPCSGAFPYLCPTSGPSFNGVTGNCDCPSCSSCDLTTTCVSVDPYLSNCSACIDVDGNGICDSTDPSTVTEPDGTFFFITDQVVSGSLVMETSPSCVDTGTGLPQANKLVAPAGSNALTPLTGALAIFPSTVSRAEQTSVLQLLFGLPVGYNLDTYDPVRALLTSQPGSVAALLGVLKLASAWDSIYGLALVDGQTAAQADQACSYASTALVASVNLDLSDPTILASLLQSVGTQAGWSLTSDQLLIGAQLLTKIWGLETIALNTAPNNTAVMDEFIRWRTLSQTYLRVTSSAYLNGSITAADYNAATTPSTLSSELAKVVVPIFGCIDASANNYNPAATTSDGSCTFDPLKCERLNCTQCAVTTGCFYCSGPVAVCMPEGFLPQGVSGIDYCRLFMQGTPSYTCTGATSVCQARAPNTGDSCSTCITSAGSCGRCELASGESFCLGDLPDTTYGTGSFTRTICSNIATTYNTTATWRDPSYVCPTTSAVIQPTVPSTSATSPTTTTTTSSEDGLSGGAIAGIVIAVLAVAAALILLFIFWWFELCCFRRGLSSKESANLDMIFVDQTKESEDKYTSDSGFSHTPTDSGRSGSGSYSGSGSGSLSTTQTGSASASRTPSGSGSGSPSPSVTPSSNSASPSASMSASGSNSFSQSGSD